MATFVHQLTRGLSVRSLLLGGILVSSPVLSSYIGAPTVIAQSNGAGASSQKNSKSKLDNSPTDRLIQELYRAPTASAALLMIDEYLLTNTLTPKDIDRLKTQRARFAELQEKKLLKFGTKWVTATERDELLARSESELTAAREDLKNRDGKSAVRRLEKASDLNPEGFEADFFLAMLFSLRGNFNPTIAEKHFERVLDRANEFVPALNNLAITETKLQNFEEALGYWRRAAAIDPRNQAVRHNVARVIHEAEQNRLLVPKKKAFGSTAKTRFDHFVDLQSQIAKAGGESPSMLRPRTGWMYLPLASAEPNRGAPDERPKLNVPKETAIVADRSLSGDLLPVLTSTGTGFAVSPDYVLTNRHVVESDDFGAAYELQLQCLAGAATNRLEGKLIAVSKSEDLALIHVPGLNATPIIPSAEAISRGRDVAVFGYPRTTLLGNSLKMTRGIISSAPEPKLSGMFLLDAEANPGNSGGPCCDTRGRLTGVITAVTREHVGDYSLAIPVSVARNFVELQNVKWAAPAEETPRKEWEQIDQLVSPSVYYIEVYHAAKPLQLAECLPEKIRPVRHELQDTSCCLCNGLGSVRCRAKGCALGSVASLEWYTTVIEAGNNQKLSMTGTKARQSRCDACDGTGRLRCPACQGSGISPDLR